MDFTSTPQESALREAARLFAVREVAPTVLARDREQRWDPGLFRALGETGMLGATVPRHEGGGGQSHLDYALQAEGLGEGGLDAGLGQLVAEHAVLCTNAIAALGTAEQKRRYLPLLTSGQWLCGFAAGEAEGFDPRGLRTRASRRGPGFLLEGHKSRVTGGAAQLFLVTAVTGHRGAEPLLTAFLVERETPGLAVARSGDLLGLRTAPLADLSFLGCELPAGSVLGAEGEAGSQLLPRLLRWERACAHAHWLGLQRALVDRCTARVRERVQTGRRLAEYQGVRAQLVDLRIRHEVCRRLQLRAAWLLDQQGPLLDRDLAVARLSLAESSQQVTEQALQLHGTEGLAPDAHVERLLRDARSLTVGLGNSGLLRSVIAAAELGL